MTTRSNASARSRSKGPRRPSSRRPTLRGKGDYSDDVKNDPDIVQRLEKKIDHLERNLVHATPSVSRAGGLAGRALGTLVGQGDLGAMAGESLAKLFGYGDYSMSVKGNSLMAGIGTTVVPKFQGDGKRGVRIMEREFLANVLSGPTLVSGSTAFNNTAYTLNPTDQTTFPWLSKIATLFDQWEPHGIVFEFVTTSSTFNGSSQALGAVVMAADYDAANPTIYGSKQEAENSDYACSTVPSANLIHGIECDPKERPTPVLFTTQRASQLNFSNLGTMQISTQGCSTAGTTLGELWVSYDVTFYKKQLVDPTALLPALSVSGLATVGNALINPTTIFVQRGITMTQIIGTGTNIAFPPNQGKGRYLYEIANSVFQTPESAQMAPSQTVNCSLTSAHYPSTYVDGSPGVLVGYIDITGAGANFVIGKKFTANGTVSLSITAVDPGFFIG